MMTSSFHIPSQTPSKHRDRGSTRRKISSFDMIAPLPHPQACTVSSLLPSDGPFPPFRIITFHCATRRNSVLCVRAPSDPSTTKHVPPRRFHHHDTTSNSCVYLSVSDPGPSRPLEPDGRSHTQPSNPLRCVASPCCLHSCCLTHVNIIIIIIPHLVVRPPLPPTPPIASTLFAQLCARLPYTPSVCTMCVVLFVHFLGLVLSSLYLSCPVGALLELVYDSCRTIGFP